MEQVELFDIPKGTARELGPLELIRKFLDLTSKADGIFLPAMAGKMLGVSRQRVDQMINAGLLETVNYCDTRYVTGRSIITRLDMKAAGLCPVGPGAFAKAA